MAASLYAVGIRATHAELGLLAGCQGLAVVVMSLPSGALVRRLGAARVFVGGSVAGGLACAAVPLLVRPWFLVACFGAVGLCIPLRVVAMNVATMRRMGREGSARAGWYRATPLVTMLVVAPAVALPVAAAVGFPATWWIVGAAFLLPAGLAPLTLGGAAPPSDRARSSARRRVVADPEALQLAATEFASQGAFAFFSFFAIPIAIERHGLSPSAAAGLLGTQATTFVLALLGLAGAASRWGRGWHALAAHGSAAAGLVLLGLARGGAWLYAGSLLLGGGLALVQLDNLVRAARVGDRAGHGAASGLFVLAGSAGGLAAGLLGGAIDPSLVFLLIAPLFAWLAVRRISPAVSGPRAARGGPGTVPSRSPASSCEPGGCAG